MSPFGRPLKAESAVATVLVVPMIPPILASDSSGQSPCAAADESSIMQSNMLHDDVAIRWKAPSSFLLMFMSKRAWAPASKVLSRAWTESLDDEWLEVPTQTLI